MNGIAHMLCGALSFDCAGTSSLRADAVEGTATKGNI
jgi:hypothetical protein